MNEVKEQESGGFGVEVGKDFRQRNYKCKGMHCALKKNHWHYSSWYKGGGEKEIR